MATLELYLIRHGIAVERENGQSDAVRPLTPDGIARLRDEAAGLDALDVRFDVVLASPLLRARQTAEVLLEAMTARVPVIICEALAPSGSPENVIAEIEKHRSRSRIALVGHEPAMGALAARLLRARTAIAFKKGGVCLIDVNVPLPGGFGTLRWFATPKLLRLAGRRSR